ncbi:hypothetical protein KI387_015233, partial [Taxus chinensis]
KEEFQHTAYATNAYLTLGSFSKQLLQGQRVIRLEMVQGPKANGQNIKKGAFLDDKSMHSGLALVLDELRKELSQKHGGIFPHAVLSSQHITMLCSQQPTAMDEVEKVLGKIKAERYGKEILECIQQYMFQNPGSTSEQWISPKKQKVSQDEKSYNKTTHRKILKPKRTFVCVSSSDDESKGHNEANDDADFQITSAKKLKNA